MIDINNIRFQEQQQTSIRSRGRGGQKKVNSITISHYNENKPVKWIYPIHECKQKCSFWHVRAPIIYTEIYVRHGQVCVRVFIYVKPPSCEYTRLYYIIMRIVLYKYKTKSFGLCYKHKSNQMFSSICTEKHAHNTYKHKQMNKQTNTHAHTHQTGTHTIHLQNILNTFGKNQTIDKIINKKSRRRRRRWE